MKQLLKKVILKIVLSKKEQDKLNFKNVILPEGFLPIKQSSDNDIFIAGFPKSGNTWMQNLIVGLLYGVNTSFLPDILTQELVPDVHGKVYYKRFNKIVFFKTHDLPQKHMKRVIHLVRDGRDVMVSYYAMNKVLRKETTLKEMIVDGKNIYPCRWHTHTRKWLDNPYNAEILIVKYEDLLNNPYQELKEILNFSGIERSDEMIHQSINGNSFNEMKRKEKEFGWNNKNWDKKENFIRKGKKGTYKKEMPEELITYFEKEAQLELECFDYI